MISVIIPTYNRSHTLPRAIDSVLSQTHTDLELLIVDDGSTDDTARVIEKYSDSRIRYLKHDCNEGQSATINTGILNCLGDYVGFLDSDDEWLPSMLERQLQKFSEDDSLGVVYTWAGIRDGDGSLRPAIEFSLEGYVYQQSLRQGYVSHTVTMLVRRGCLHAAGLWDDSFQNCNDDDFSLRLAKRFKFGLIPEILAIIDTDSVDGMMRDKVDRAEGWLKLIQKFENDILNLCGKEILASHYLKSANLFKQVGDLKRMRIAIRRTFHLSPSAHSLKRYLASQLPLDMIETSRRVNAKLNGLFNWQKLQH